MISREITGQLIANHCDDTQWEHKFEQIGRDHDDVMTWLCCPHYWPFVRGIHRVAGGFPSQRVSNGSFDIFFVLSLNKLLTKQSICRWFETLWRWCDVTVREQSICADCLGWKVCGEEKNGTQGEPIYISVSAAALFGDNYDFFNYKIYNCRGQTSVTVLSCHWSLYLGRWICWQILNR